MCIRDRSKETEGNRLLSHIRDTDYVITLAIEGKMLDSVEPVSYTHLSLSLPGRRLPTEL